MRVWSASGPPCGIDHDGKPGDTKQRYGERDSGIERADHHAAVKCIDCCDQPKDDHDRRKAEGDDTERTMPADTPGRDKSGLHEVEDHPERESRSVHVQNGAWKRGLEYASAEVSRRKANDDDRAEQDRHAAKEDAFGGAVDGSVNTMRGREWRRDDRFCCHSILQLGE